jgi:hypothetical protein
MGVEISMALPLSNLLCFRSERGRIGFVTISLLTLIFLYGCEGEKYRYEDFANADASNSESLFKTDHQVCQEEKDKYINKIQGREFGFRGSETGYLGCMKLRGWDKKISS